MKVICINNNYRPEVLDYMKKVNALLPNVNETYTVDEISMHENGEIYITLLEDISHKKHHYSRFGDMQGVVLSYEYLKELIDHAKSQIKP
jgi:hypothetical protein